LNINDDLCDNLIVLSAEKYNLNLKKYRKIVFYIDDPDAVNMLITKCDFKIIKQNKRIEKVLKVSTETILGYELPTDDAMINRIAISKKFKAILAYNAQNGSVYCICLIHPRKLMDFSKLLNPIMQNNFGTKDADNIFKDMNFQCSSGEYIEISKISNKKNKRKHDDHMKDMPVNVLKKEIHDEKLVFEDTSALSDIMKDMVHFFNSDTEKLYKKMQINYKRGVIMYGNPGNGKSSVIREIIRRVGTDINKIVINPNISYEITNILPELITALDGAPSIIIMEDLDSFIAHANRSQFLNILDGIDMKSGVYFIGTTNYPERIDPAFINRSGRFDQIFRIENPSNKMRELFFQSHNIDELIKDLTGLYSKDIVKTFVDYTNGLPMSDLKEIITSVNYILINNMKISLEVAVKRACEKLKFEKLDHLQKHMEYQSDIEDDNRNKKVKNIGPYARAKAGGISLVEKLEEEG